MNKTVIALALIIIAIASALTASFAYLVLLKSPEQDSSSSTETATTITPSPSSAASNQENNSTTPSASQPSTSSPASASLSPATSSPASPSPTQTETPAYTPAPDSAYPEGIRAWLPYGTFVILSPANQTYTTNNLILNVTGGVISGDSYLPYLSYSLNGGQRVLVPITLTKPEVLAFTFQRVISGSIALPPLSNGSHVIVLYGDLGFDSRKGKVTVYFDVELAS